MWDRFNVHTYILAQGSEGRIWKEAIVTYSNLLTQQYPGHSEKPWKITTDSQIWN